MAKVVKSIDTDKHDPSIIKHEGKWCVSARESHLALGYDPSNWKKWYQRNILRNPFAIPGQDYFELVLSTSRTRDFALTLDFAKKLAMQARTERGEQVRDYFLECEERLKATKNLSTPTAILLEAARRLHDHEQQIHNLSERVSAIETTSAGAGYYSVVGFASKKKRYVDLRTAAALGSKASAACRRIGAVCGQIPDPRFGTIRTYPQEVLEAVFTDFFSER